MKWKFNDDNVLEIDNLDAYFIKAEFRLFTGTELPTLELSVQYSDDSNHLRLGDEVKGSLSDSSKTHSFEGYVFEVKEGVIITYGIMLRKKEYFNTPDNDRYDSPRSAIEKYETINSGSMTNEAKGSVHGFNSYGCNLVDRLAQGLTKGIYARSWNSLVIRDPENDPADLIPQLDNIRITGVIDQVSNKYSDLDVASTDLDDWCISELGSFSCYHKDYKNFYENAYHNKMYNISSQLELECMALLPFEPGMIIDTSFINAYKDDNIPQMMYVSYLVITIEKSLVNMKVVLAK